MSLNQLKFAVRNDMLFVAARFRANHLIEEDYIVWWNGCEWWIADLASDHIDKVGHIAVVKYTNKPYNLGVRVYAYDYIRKVAVIASEDYNESMQLIWRSDEPKRPL